MSNNVQVTMTVAKRLVKTIINANLVAILKGSPGLGKSSMIHEIATEGKLKVIDLRLAQCDPVDLLGFPMIGKSGKAGYQPMDTFPLSTDEVPVGFNGWLLFLDEITSAAPSVQAAAYKLILDRMVGQHRLHDKVYIVGAGNLETDNAVVEPMSTALQSRLIHIELRTDVDEWLSWANKKNFDTRITSYINWKKDTALFNFSPDHTDNTFACPRTWEFANRLLKAPGTPEELLALMAGTIGQGMAREFLSFVKIYSELPRIEDILAKPATHKVPEGLSIQYALTGALAAVATKDNLDSLVTYIERLSAEMQMITFKSIIQRNYSIVVKHPTFRKWATQITEYTNQDI